jgi:hypothetical protein
MLASTMRRNVRLTTASVLAVSLALGFAPRIVEAWVYRGTITDDSGTNAILTVGRTFPPPKNTTDHSAVSPFRCDGAACFSRHGSLTEDQYQVGGYRWGLCFAPRCEIACSVIFPPPRPPTCNGLIQRYECYRAGSPEIIGSGTISMVLSKCVRNQSPR